MKYHYRNLLLVFCIYAIWFAISPLDFFNILEQPLLRVRKFLKKKMILIHGILEFEKLLSQREKEVLEKGQDWEREKAKLMKKRDELIMKFGQRYVDEHFTLPPGYENEEDEK